jgi:hypothetical protein
MTLGIWLYNTLKSKFIVQNIQIDLYLLFLRQSMKVFEVEN